PPPGAPPLPYPTLFRSLVLAAAAVGFGGRLDMGSSAPTMIAARQRVPALSAVPPVLRTVIAPMLEPRPVARPPSMRALLVDVNVDRKSTRLNSSHLGIS